MSTIQIVGIAVAAVVVLLLVIALVVTRESGDEDHGEETAAATAAPGTSFLDAPPSDTLERLGKPERPPDEEPATGVAAPTPSAAAPVTAPRAMGGEAEESLGLDWDHGHEPGPGDGGPAVATGEAPAPEAPPLRPATAAGEAADDSETTGEMPAVEAEAPKGKLVPLSSIIVTTSTKMVDLEDPEVRRMLTELVTFEIDQATQYREQGQMVDAVLQLTEAEKICRALGKLDTAREIRDMMRGLQA